MFTTVVDDDSFVTTEFDGTIRCDTDRTTHIYVDLVDEAGVVIQKSFVSTTITSP